MKMKLIVELIVSFQMDLSAVVTGVPFEWSRCCVTCEREHGIIEVFGKFDVERLLRAPDKADPLPAAETAPHTDVICLLVSPSVMIPAELLQYFRAYTDGFMCVRIFRHFKSDKYLALFQLKSIELAQSFVTDYYGGLLSSLDDTRCLLFGVRQLVCFAGDITGQLEYQFAGPFDSADVVGVNTEGQMQSRVLLANMPCSPSLGLSSPGARARAPSLLSALETGKIVVGQPLSSASISSKAGLPVNSCLLSEDDHDDSSAASCAPLQGQGDPELCVLCLERLAGKGVVTTYCSHTFHIECIIHLDGPQCPICRFQHDEGVEIPVQCMDCLALGLHSGLTPMFSAENISSTLEDGTHSVMCDTEAFGGTDATDMWMCVICGFVGCGESRRGHIQRHYDLSLHAYAVDIRTRLVWDFAGSGYVHRLLLLSNEYEGDPADRLRNLVLPAGAGTDRAVDGAEDSLGTVASGVGFGGSSAHGPRRKVAEVVDPNSESFSRPTAPPILVSQNQARSKVSAAASQLDELLLWHLEKQRKQYEARLNRIRDTRETFASETEDMNTEDGDIVDGQRRDKNISNNVYGWKEVLLAQVQVEKLRLTKQRAAAQQRLSCVSHELDTLKCLEDSLIHNQKDWEGKLQTSAQRLQEAEESSRLCTVLCRRDKVS
jgi:hypothetical protein